MFCIFHKSKLYNDGNPTGEWIFYNKEGLIVGKGTYDGKGVEKDGIFVKYQRNSTIDDIEIEKVKIYKDGYLIETKEY